MRHAIAMLAGIAVLGASGGAVAQSIGQQEYMNSCAQCHGAGGTGDGPMVGFLMGSMPDLTQLQKENNGVFPVTKVYSTIDGTMTSGPHGSAEMPIWGSRYKMRGMQGANPDFRAEEAETFTRFRILALTEYISTIQEQ